METNQFETSSFTEEQLKLQPQAEGFLKETTKWAKFLAILNFIILGLATPLAISIIFMSLRLNGAIVLLGGIFIIGIFGIVFYLAYLLYKFSTEVSYALVNRKTDMLTEGFRKLKSYYKISGIITIVVICFYIIYFIVMGAFLASAFSGSGSNF